MSKLKEVYKGSFKNRARYDDGGSAYSSYADPFSGSTDPSNYVDIPNSGMPSAADIAALTSSATTDIPGQISSEVGAANAADALGGTNGPSIGGLGGGSANGAAGSAGAGALAKLLGLSSGSPGLTALAALAGLGGAAANFANNKANTPVFNPPAMFGGAPGTGAPAAGQSNGGYGPPGGYNYKNYAGLTNATPGLGYAPRSPTSPNIPNYYTYGQGPQASFFTTTPQTMTPPTGAPPGMTAPVSATSSMGLQPNQGPQMRTFAKGGLMKKYAIGGMVQTPMSGMPGGQPQPMLPRPMPSPGQQMMRQQLPSTRPMMGFSRPMADGGSASPTADIPPPGPSASSHVVGGQGVNPLSQMFPQHRQWAGPSAATPHADGGALSRHVVGPGDGTSDDIPARLANGEYVMDAQTVSMVGNGSNDAGAKKLDQFRSEIRKHKGKALAKGEMAPNAHKNLHRYMGGKS